MSKHSKKYNSAFKLKVVLKYLSEEDTATQIINKFSISKATLYKWVKQFKKNSSLIFNEVNSNKKPKGFISDKEASNLYAKIGQLTIERDFLKKVLDS